MLLSYIAFTVFGFFCGYVVCLLTRDLGMYTPTEAQHDLDNETAGTKYDRLDYLSSNIEQACDKEVIGDVLNYHSMLCSQEKIFLNNLAALRLEFLNKGTGDHASTQSIPSDSSTGTGETV